MKKPHTEPPDAKELFGYAVHHVLRARFCIERSRYWEAEYWISSARDLALSLACRARGLPAFYGRGFDALPTDVHETFLHTLVTSLEREELLRALDLVIDGLVGQADEIREMADQIEPQLRELTAAWDR